MKTLQLKENLYFIGVVDHDLKVFDVMMETKFGTTYNSYLLKTNEGAIVFEGAKEEFSKEYIENIKSIVDIEEIKYLVVSHTEPDHSGAISHLLNINPNIVVLASMPALNNLKHIINEDFKSQVMRAGSCLKVGQYTLEFISGINLHWPDVMFTYIQELQTLVSCDAFGAHYATDEVLLSKEKNIKEYQEAFEFYYKAIMGPFPQFVKQAVERVEKLDLDMILVGHGPVLDCKIKQTLTKYHNLSIVPTMATNKATIVYSSCYGYTEAVAKKIKEKLEEKNFMVDFYKVDVLNFASQKDKIKNSILSSKLVMLGSPTIVGDAVPLMYNLLNQFNTNELKGKKGSIFGSYGWSGEAINNLSNRLNELHLSVIPGYKFLFKNSRTSDDELEEYCSSLL